MLDYLRSVKHDKYSYMLNSIDSLTILKVLNTLAFIFAIDELSEFNSFVLKNISKLFNILILDKNSNNHD